MTKQFQGRNQRKFIILPFHSIPCHSLPFPYGVQWPTTPQKCYTFFFLRIYLHLSSIYIYIFVYSPLMPSFLPSFYLYTHRWIYMYRVYVLDFSTFFSECMFLTSSLMDISITTWATPQNNSDNLGSHQKTTIATIVTAIVVRASASASVEHLAKTGFRWLQCLAWLPVSLRKSLMFCLIFQ